MQKQKTIDRIREGSFDYGSGSLEFSCSKIEFTIQKGQQQEGSFYLHASGGLPAEGFVLSTDWRMECLTEGFCGEEGEVFFRFHGERLEEGDVVKGSFDIVSDRGEYYIPFVVSVEHALPESSIGTVKNLFHFANLAKSDWGEAVKLFYSPAFLSVLSGSDARYLEDYRALSARRGQEQNMEEFLIQANKKGSIAFVLEEPELRLELSGSGAERGRELCVLIRREGWGYTKLSVEWEGDFLFIEKEVLTDDDFLGNLCRLPVFVDRARLREGKSFGRVRLYNSYLELSVPVTVRLGDGPPVNRKRGTVRLMELYQDFRLRRISAAVWLKESGKLAERMAAMDESDISARLFQAQLLITEERRNEAGWVLDQVAEQFERRRPEDTLLAYYLYLTTLIREERGYVAKVAEDVERMFRRDDGNWRIAWLLLCLSDGYCRSEGEKWDFWERLFQKGCNSPVLYIEALALVNGNPALLRRLGRFERQVAAYGVRQGALKREAAEQVLSLAGRLKEYSDVLFRVLAGLYERKKDQRILQEICTLLIKGGKSGPAYFDWYRAGVEAQLRITNLYEYFMLSLDLGRQQEIPKAVLRYFSYQNNLDYVRTAYLYDYVSQRQDRLGDLYGTYRFQIEGFVLEQIRKGHIDRNLANLYGRFLHPGMVDEETSVLLAKLLFAHLIQVEDGRLRKVYVYQAGNLCPEEYDISEKRTWVALYGSRYTIVFEDVWGNRFLRSAEYTLEKLMIPGKFLRLILPFGDLGPGLDFYLCDSESACREEPEERVRRELRIVASDRADPQMKRELYLRILQHYYDTEDTWALDGYLRRLPPEELDARGRAEAARIMVLRESWELVWEWLKEYGPYFVDVKLLVRLTGALMERRAMEEDPLLTAMALYIFHKGKYDGTVLEYLVRHCRGLTRNLRDIWKAARSFGTDCYRLSERILVQMLYSGAFVGEKMEIFRYYVSQGARPEVEEAFLAQCAYDCFVRERLMEKEAFREIRQMYLRGEPVQLVCKLAYLKCYAENRRWMDGGTDEMVEALLEEMLGQGIYLEFFQLLGVHPRLWRELSDKTILEYRMRLRTKLCVHYRILDEEGEAKEYRSEYMEEAYGGVCFKPFVLFFGESVQYYFTEERDGVRQVTGSGVLVQRDGSGEDGRYQLIDDIATAKSVQDYDAMGELLEEYYRKDFLNGRLFRLR